MLSKPGPLYKAPRRLSGKEGHAQSKMVAAEGSEKSKLFPFL